MKLFEEFAPLSTEDWLKRIEKDLKGKPFDTLMWELEEGIRLQPFYRREDVNTEKQAVSSLPGEFPYRRGNIFNAADTNWQIVQEIHVDDVFAAIDRMKEAAQNEVRAFRLTYRDVSKVNTESYQRILTAAANLNQQAFHLDAADGQMVSKALQGLLMKEDDYHADLFTGTLINDPISAATRARKDVQEGTLHHCANLIKTHHLSPYFRSLTLDLTHIHESGGNIQQQLAFALSMMVDYVQMLPDYGVEQEEILKKMAFQFAIGGAFFPEIAKFRAFRSLFAHTLEAMDIHGHDLQSPFILAQTARWNKTLFDSYNNLLRSTTEAISAVLGGAQAVSVSAFDVLLKSESAFSARLARNIQLLLKYESRLNQVIDPAGGSYYVETLTDQLGEKAWQLFQKIEAEGGYSAALKKGMIGEELEKSASRKQEAIAKRKQVLVGINQYANTEEELKWEEGAVKLDELSSRAAHAFEKIRFQLQARESKAKVLLLSFGPLKMRKARAQFSRNLLGAAGFHIQENQDPDNLQASVEEAKQEQPDIIVLCSDNASYQKEAKEIISSIRKQLPDSQVLIAGKLKESLGEDEMLFAGMNALRLLQELVDKLDG